MGCLREGEERVGFDVVVETEGDEGVGAVEVRAKGFWGLCTMGKGDEDEREMEGVCEAV